MRRLLLSILTLSSLAGAGQIETNINVPYTPAASPTWQALAYFPPDYPSTSNKYPLIIFLHGSGESCPPTSKIYNSTSGGIPYAIEHGQWPADGGFINPADGQKYKPIVLSPQSGCNSWSAAGDQVDNIINYAVNTYRIDPNRIYLTGVSSGGGGDIEYTAHITNDGTEGHQGATRHWKIAAQVPMSLATISPVQAWANQIVADGTHTWGHGDPNADTYGENTMNLLTFINRAGAGMGVFTANNFGHGGWNNIYNPTYHQTINGVSVNIYEWMLQFTQNNVTSSPTADAGTPQTITLPVSTVNLTGTGTPGTGHSIASYLWTQLSGPSSTITTPATANTSITGMSVAGTYVYQLKVTNEAAAFATSSVTITVNAAGVVAVISPTSAALILPTNSLTLSSTGSTGAITSYAWSQVSGPPGATNQTPTASSTIFSNLVAGTYVFRLSLNGGVSTKDATVTVSAPSPYPPCGPGRSFNVTPGGDGGFYANYPFVSQFLPGDTLKCSAAYNGTATYFELDNFKGNPACPLVVINTGGQVKFQKQMYFDGSTYVKVTGSGVPGVQYGFLIEQDPKIRRQGPHAMIVRGRSRNVEIERVFMHNVDMGIVCETNEDCGDSLNYPNWILDSMYFHDNRIVGTWNEGMYIGNTSPDNATYDLRPIVCNGVTKYPAPMKNGYTRIFNNFVDSTGRGGIQLANALATSRISEISFNTIGHSGLNGDDAQGSGITLGLYTQAWVHHNDINNTLTWAIASVGACGDSAIIIEDNTTDSSGMLRNYPRLATAPDTASYDPATEPTFPNPFTYVFAIWIDTKTRMYTNDTPNPGTAVPGHDSTGWIIRNNHIGLFRCYTSGTNQAAIQVEEQQPGLKKRGNVICNNTSTKGQTITIYTLQPTIQPVVYSSSCGTPPTAGAGSNQTINPPATATSLTGTATAAGGATIVSTFWVKSSGPTGGVIVSPATLNTSITGLVPGVYVYLLTVTDSNGLVTTASVTITVNAPAPPPTSGSYLLQHRYKKHRHY